MLEASMELPIPTGDRIEFQNSNQYRQSAEFIREYIDLFNISRDVDPKTGIPSQTELNISIKLDTPAKMLKFKEFLENVENLRIPAPRYYAEFASVLNEYSIMDNIQPTHIPSLFGQLKKVVDNHNMYYENLGTYRLAKVVNNATMYGMYKVSKDPVNLVEAHTSVDGTTGPLKKKANTSLEAAEASFRTPGNAYNQFEGINENQVGKKGISICATGLKSFFGLTQYYNYLLNNGNSEEQQRILLPKGGVTIGGKTYYSLANIRAMNINTIKNSEVFEALSKVTQDEDVALTLSALLSLATDNAKELALSKLNAGTKMLGMYVYGLSIGMNFNDVANIMMSPVGNVIKGLLDDDVFSGREAFPSVDEALFKYFTDGPFRQLNKYNVIFNSEGNKVQSPTYFLQDYLVRRGVFKDMKKAPTQLSAQLVEIAKRGSSIIDKISIFENLRADYKNRYPTYSSEMFEIYNQLIDFCEDYISQSDTIWKNEDIFTDFIKLAEGAKELKVVGQVLGLNKGLKTTPDELLTQLNNLRRAIYDKTGNLEDLVDLTKFAFDETPYTVPGQPENTYKNYREYIINKYEVYKTAFNLFDLVSKVPHIMGYLQTLCTAHLEVSNAFTFRTQESLLLPAKKLMGEYVKEDKLAKGIQSYCGDYLLRHWMLDAGKSVVIPSGNLAFDKNGNQYPLTEDTRIQLGTEYGNATFRMWMENEVIPNLKEGIIEPNKSWSRISNNKFIKDLGYDLLTRTVSKNSTTVQTLPINMLPSTDQERSIFNQYKSQFNDLTYEYKYNATINVQNEDGTITKRTEPQAISITDLFTYYAMIANGWKLDQASLVPITEDLQNVGIIKEFHDYITEIDKSGFILNENNINWDDLMPFITPHESYYTSTANYIWARNPKTMKKERMRRLSKAELKELQENNIPTSNLFGKKYKSMGTTYNTNFFSKDTISSSTGRVSSNGVTINYDIQSNTITAITGQLNSDIMQEVQSSLNKEFKGKIPLINGNKAKIPNMPLIDAVIKHILNKC